MAETSGQERTEEATPRRRQQARRKGTVAKSMDLTGAIVLLTATLVLPTAVGMLADGFRAGLAIGLQAQPADLSPQRVGFLLAKVALVSAPGLGLLVGCLMLVGVGVNFAQVGFVMSGEALTPTLSKLNPLLGFQRLFSMRAGFEGLKAVAKSGLFAYLVWGVINAHWTEMTQFSTLPPVVALAKTGGIIQQAAMRVGLLWLVLGAVDYFFQRRQVNKQLRMTKEEVRQEMKELEQSPELRSAIALRRRRLMRARLSETMKQADVVVTNPTHYAVALKYRIGKDHAPQVVAKGADHIAAKIREFASEYRVPLVPNPPLARALYRKCELGDYVPRELFQAVAEVLAYVYRTVKTAKKPTTARRLH